MSASYDARAPDGVSSSNASRGPRPPLSRARQLRRSAEAALADVALALSGALPLDAASAVGGWLARTLGPALGISDRARRNLRRIFPELSAPQIEQIVGGMWDNLGRTVAEYPHLKQLAERADLVGEEHVTRALARAKPIIFVTAHVGNWELGPAVAARIGVPVHLIYRPINNTALDAIVQRFRSRVGGVGMIPRGREGVRRTLEVLANGEHLGMLLDQRVSRGLAMPFLGQAAVARRSLAHFALRFDCSVLPFQVVRLQGARLRLTVYPAIELAAGADRAENMRTIMTRVNTLMEDWVLQHPEQWLWLHRRWRD